MQFKMSMTIVGLDKPKKPELDTISMEDMYALKNEIGAGYVEISQKGEIPFPDIIKVMTYGIVTKLKNLIVKLLFRADLYIPA
ncbi:MAG: hypothetical protein EU533_06660 [Promethearchaeota archaeon]|nr:MAG: hypothetical protein EU533_06660 [Candidatus Lokiarchaeota archaeon]